MSDFLIGKAVVRKSGLDGIFEFFLIWVGVMRSKAAFALGSTEGHAMIDDDRSFADFGFSLGGFSWPGGCGGTRKGAL